MRGLSAIVLVFAVAFGVARPNSAAADTLAIVHAEAWTMTGAEPVKDATIVVNDGKIVAVQAGTSPPAGARVLDAKGRRVTPGLIHAATRLGLVELPDAKETQDAAISAGSFGAGFDIQYALNPNSPLIALARADGLTSAVSYPASTKTAPFSGMGAALRLHAGDSVLDRPGVGVFVTIGGYSSEGAGGSRAAQWLLLRGALDAARKAASRTIDVQALEQVLSGAVPLAISTNRESDIRQAIRLAADYKVRVVIIGGAEAWRTADALAAAQIPVIVDPEENLPDSFDSIGLRADNAALLHKAGVKVATVVMTGSHQSFNAGLSMREGAGRAVANGLPYIEALRAVTVIPAQIWGMADRYGTIEPGKAADLVIWDGDPLEPASTALTVIIGGKEMSLVTRQTKLRDRYMRKTGLLSAAQQSP